VFDALSSLFTEEWNYQDSAQKFEELTYEIQQLIDTIKDLTFAELSGELKKAEADLQYYYDLIQHYERKHYEQMVVYYQAIYDQTQEWINSIKEREIYIEEAKGIKNMPQLQAFLDEWIKAGKLTYDEAKQIIDYYVSIWDLSKEQELDLWELIGDLFDQGTWTLDQWMDYNRNIKGLQDDIAEERKRTQEAAREKKEESQIYRTVTTITERQADLLLGVINTISEYVRQILDLMQGTFRTAGQIGGGISNNFYGGINQYFTGIEATPQGGQQLAVAFRNELRSRGVKL
jgi:hypothetical protein